MDEIELTQLFVEYAKTRDLLEDLRQKIVDEVVGLGESRKIAGVEAKYYKPSIEMDHKTPVILYWEKNNICLDDREQYLQKFTTYTPSVSWKNACIDLKLEPVAGENKPARVVVK